MKYQLTITGLFAVILLSLPAELLAQRAFSHNQADPYASLSDEEITELLLDSESPSEDAIDKTVIVSASRHEIDAYESSRMDSSLSKTRIQELTARTTPEMLDSLPGFWLQKTNHGGGQPIVRGRFGNHILLLFDGIRLNNSIYRSGCNQYLNTLGRQLIQQVEVIHGPAAVQYGSDAIGATINVIPRDPLDGWSLVGNGILLGLHSQAGSADEEFSSSLSAALRTESMAALVNVSYSDFSDLRAGARVGKQPYTGYEQSTFDARLSSRLTHNQHLKLSYSGMRQINVPRSDMCSELDCLYYDEQFRDLVYAKYRATDIGSLSARIDASLSYQRHHERWRRNRIDKDMLQRQRIDVDTLGAWFQVLLPLSSHMISFGAEVYHDQLQSGRTDSTLNGAGAQEVRGKFAPRADYSLADVYIQDEWMVAEDWVLRLGSRLSTHWANIPNDPLIGTFRNQAAGLVGSISVLWHLSDWFNINVGLHQGHRSPNLYDLTATGRFSAGWDVANPKLEAEDALMAEIGIKARSKYFRGSLFYYYTHLDNLIERTPWLIEGLPSYDGEAVFHRANIHSGAIQGVELAGQIRLGRYASVFFNAAWTEGNNLSQGVTPLSRIPPFNGLAGLRIQSKHATLFFEFSSRFAEHQDRLSIQDVNDVRIGPNGTGGFVVLSASCGWRIAKNTIWRLSANNLTDKLYRYHGSGIYQPGINIRTAIDFNYEMAM